MSKTTQAVRILIIDDDEDDFFITSEYIRAIEGQTFVIDWCHNYQDGIDNICNSRYDLYLVDYRLGAKTGLDLLKEAMLCHCEDPIILLTGKGNQYIDIEAMQAGAVDYLLKPELNTEKLERCIRYSLERSVSTKALRANERKFRGIFEKSKDMVFLADENMVFKDVNPASSVLLGYTKEELLRLSLFSLLNTENKLMIRQELAEAGYLDDKEIELFTNRREKKVCIISVSREKESNGSTYLQGIIHDITNLKKAEKVTLQIEKLGATGRLVRTLAHEVRNPLNNIQLALDQIEPTMQDLPLYLDIIARNSKRIGALISELLDSARPTEIVKQKKALQEIVDASIAVALDRINLKKITYRISYPEKPAYIMADTEKLKIAFLNIIINAVEAMEESTGMLEISIADDPHSHQVYIKDNGCGITEENLSRLFEPYFTSKRNGMGLGLATSLNIIQSHKASVEVQSSPNQGTTFMLQFEKIVA
ncbi:MAG TPA: ATP-binding protein [Chitinophagaceae bacterium]